MKLIDVLSFIDECCNVCVYNTDGYLISLRDGVNSINGKYNGWLVEKMDAMFGPLAIAIYVKEAE